jgi:hypothetical protein
MIFVNFIKDKNLLTSTTIKTTTTFLQPHGKVRKPKSS